MLSSTSPTTIEIRPQPGKQEQFLSSPADIVFYGGGAGGGKTFGLLLEPLRYITKVRGFGGVIFRRETPQITAEGGLYDESKKLYPAMGAYSRESPRIEWVFGPYNNKVSFAHMQLEKNMLDWQGSQICYLGFDELTHFTREQFFYMLSRNRSTCEIKPYIRATCNPDAGSWVAEFIQWYWDPETGYVIPERSGVIRFFQRIDNDIYWGSTEKELWDQIKGRIGKQDFAPKSFTFISAKLEDNPILVKSNPEYRSNLLSLSLVDRERLLSGNWKIRETAGMMFRGEWFEIVESYPESCSLVRFWDLAATENAGDYTAGCLMGKNNGLFYIIDMQWVQGSPQQVNSLLERMAIQDGRHVRIRLEEERGSSGKILSASLARGIFSGYDAKGVYVTGSKVTRASPLSSASENRLVKIVRGNWNQRLIDELEAFPIGNHDDGVDACSGCYNAFATGSEPAVIARTQIPGKYSKESTMNDPLAYRRRMLR